MKGLSVKKESSFWPLFCAYAGYIIWGFGYLFTKVAQGSAVPSVVLSHRFGIGALIMLVLVLTKRVKVSFKGKKIWPAVLMVGFQYLYYLFEGYAILHTNATLTGASGAVSPVIAVILAVFFLKEYPTKRQAIFCTLPIIGVIMMSMAGKSLGVVTPLGIVFLVLTILVAGAYKTANRKASEQYDTFERTFLLMLVSSVSFTITAMNDINWDLKTYVAPFAVPSYVGSVLVLSVFCSIVCNLLANYATGKLSVMKMSSFGAVMTLVSMIAGVVFLHEPWDYTLVVGAVLVLVGIWQVTKK